MTAVGGPHALEVLLVAEQLRRPASGGIGTYTRGLLRGLASVPEDALALSIYASAPAERPDPLGALGYPLELSHLSTAPLVRLWDLGLLRAPRGAAVVHAVSLASPAARAPLVVTVHDLAWRALPSAFPPRGRRWHEAALRRARRRAAHFVVPSVATREALIAAGIAPGRCSVIPEAADHLAPADEEGTERLLASLGVRGEYLLSVGTLEPRKNLERLVLAYRLARRVLAEELPLLIVGPRGWGAALGAPADDVVVTGAVEPGVLSGLYARARLLAYVPLLEGFGLPALEAMQLRVPVVSSVVPSAGAASFVVDPNEVESIAEGLVAVASSAERRRELVLRGSEHARAFSWSKTAGAHLELWREIGART